MSGIQVLMMILFNIFTIVGISILIFLKQPFNHIYKIRNIILMFMLIIIGLLIPENFLISLDLFFKYFLFGHRTWLLLIVSLFIYYLVSETKKKG